MSDPQKTRYDFVSPAYENLVAQVFTMGAEKHGDFGWRDSASHSEMTTRCYNALRRHIGAWKGGEKNDKEDGLPHLAHAIANCYILMDLEDL